MALPARRLSRSPSLSPAPEPASRHAIERFALDEDEPLFLSLLLVTSVAAAIFIAMVRTWELPPDATETATAVRLIEDIPRVVLPRPEPVVSPTPDAPAAPAPPRPNRPAPAPAPPSDRDLARAAQQARERMEARLGALGQGALAIQKLATAGDQLVKEAGEAVVYDGPVGTAPSFSDGVASVEPAEPGVKLQKVGGGLAKTGEQSRPDVRRRLQVAPPQPLDVPMVEGVQQVVKAHRGQLEACVTRALNLDPTLSGRITLSWNIALGRVQNASVIEASGDPALDGCMQKVVSRMTFPSSISGEVEAYTFVVTGQ